MFIVTMVFMAAMVFTIQGLLFSYSRDDVSGIQGLSGSYIIENIETSFQRALDSSVSCPEARASVTELREMMGSRAISGHDLAIAGDVSCPGGSWLPSGPDLVLDVTVTRETGVSETRATLLLSRTT